MNILITGGAGFIGSHLSEKLISLDHNVVIIDNLVNGNKKNLGNIINNKKLKLSISDIRDKKTIEKEFENIDIVFHLAALADIVPSIENPNEYYSTNVTGTFNILDLSKKYNVKKIIYAASSSCYGIAKEIPTTENALIQPQYPYALTKYLGEELIKHWGIVYGLNYISLRFFNVYGPRSRTSGTYGAVFGVFLAQKLAKIPFTVVGDGNQKRDFTYVDDIIDSLISSMNKGIKNEIFNIGSGNCYSINYLTDLIGGKKIFIPKRPGEPDKTFANIDKAIKLLDWKPKVSFELGVEKILKNISYWSDAPVWNPKSIDKATKKWFQYLK